MVVKEELVISVREAHERQWVFGRGRIASEQLEMGYGSFEELKAWKGATG